MVIESVGDIPGSVQPFFLDTERVVDFQVTLVVVINKLHTGAKAVRNGNEFRLGLINIRQAPFCFLLLFDCQV